MTVGVSGRLADRPADQGVAAKTEHYVLLDGMRGIAAIAVLALHVQILFDLQLTLVNAPLAVDFFLCLSGLVVAHAYDARVGAMGVRGLMWRRLVRLYPMIAVGVAVGLAQACIDGAKHNHPVLLTLAALAMVPISLMTGDAVAYPLNAPMWSLFFEFCASAAYGLEQRRAPVRWLLGLAGVLGVALAVVLARHPLVLLGLGGRLPFLAGFLRLGYPFLLGVLFHRLAPKLPRVPDWLVALALCLVLAAPFKHWLVSEVGALVLMPGLVLLGSAARTGAAGRIWSALGRLSYPLYIVHAPVLGIVRHFTLAWPAWASIGLGVALVLATAYAALILFDEPVRRWLARMSGARSQPRPAGPEAPLADTPTR